MGLYKEETLGNGVVLRYHRVVSVNTVTNVQTTVEVASYTSYEKRQEEAAAIPLGAPHDVYIHTRWYTTDYDPAMSVENAYEYVKTLEDFEGATDKIEPEGEETTKVAVSGDEEVTE